MLDFNLTMKQLTTNPGGKGSAYMAARYAIKNDLDVRYAMIMKNVKSMTTQIFEGLGFILYYLSVPSEKGIPGLFYDVVFQFFFDGNVIPDDLMDLPLKVYSNNPSFVFTYAFVCYTNDLIPKFLYNKMNDESKKTPPSTRNQFEQLGFEKSLYFAARYLIDNGYLNIPTIPKKAINKFSEIKLTSKIKNFDDKLSEVYKLKKEAETENVDLIDDKDVKDNKQLAKSKVAYRNTIKPIRSVSTVGTNNKSRTKQIKVIKTIGNKK